MKHYCCRLLTPRASFPADMSAAERALMQAHAAYWRERMGEGRVVVFGPVSDPRGAWGLLVLQLPDDTEPAALTDGDPVVRAACGFRFEIHPMQAVLPESLR
jgi:Uncharacterized protein conserved in bacteria